MNLSHDPSLPWQQGPLFAEFRKTYVSEIDELDELGQPLGLNGQLATYLAHIVDQIVSSDSRDLWFDEYQRVMLSTLDHAGSLMRTLWRFAPRDVPLANDAAA